MESSFGRVFPRFYIRGLGNTDFDLNASQPVSVLYDGVVLENTMLKGFPVFDLNRNVYVPALQRSAMSIENQYPNPALQRSAMC